MSGTMSAPRRTPCPPGRRSRIAAAAVAALCCALQAVPAAIAPARAEVLVQASPARHCRIDFTVEVTQGVGFIRPGTRLDGHTDFTTNRSFRQDDGTIAHLATGRMNLGEDISGPVWTLITTARDFSPDFVGIYAEDVTGLSFAGTDFEGPMSLNLFGDPGTRPEPVPPVTQAEWDALALRRSFQLSGGGGDMLAGNVVRFVADCG
ncbi:hypothetical protein HKCCE2091_14140 [Rhodobacterales bacterium HKCCE2091]|nr:hypothetical protein [Rhodobacterales bacterium HKCCE2091]